MGGGALRAEGRRDAADELRDVLERAARVEHLRHPGGEQRVLVLVRDDSADDDGHVGEEVDERQEQSGDDADTHDERGVQAPQAAQLQKAMDTAVDQLRSKFASESLADMLPKGKTVKAAARGGAAKRPVAKKR